MSAFLMDRNFFTQLARELRGAVESDDNLKYAVARFAFGRYDALYAETRNRLMDKIEGRVRELYLGNVDAVNQRYTTELNEIEDLEFTGTSHRTWSRVQLYKHLNCLHYQMSEGNVPQSEIYEALTKFKAEIAETIVSRTAEYDKAAWGL